VTDPYLVVTGSFRLDFTTFLIFPDASLGLQDRAAISNCVARLQLNSDDAYVNERARVVYSYVEAKLPLVDLQRFYPFIASELVAQDFDANFLATYQQALTIPKLRAALVAQGVLDP
jgi:hypothetical protein